MLIRKYTSADCEQMAEMFYQTVHTVNAKDYSKAQLDAWADGNVDLAALDRSFSTHFTLVAVQDDMIVGFGDIDETGYLDRLYVHKNYQRRGIATAICDGLEQAVRAARITTHASITARPFFMQRGYRTIKEQHVIRRGVTLTNYIMEK